MDLHKISEPEQLVKLFEECRDIVSQNNGKIDKINFLIEDFKDLFNSDNEEENEDK